MTGRSSCGQCHAQTLTVRVAGRETICDWPWSVAGGVAVFHTTADAWEGRWSPPGEPLLAGEKRFRVHECGEPVRDLSEPLRAAS